MAVLLRIHLTLCLEPPDTQCFVFFFFKLNPNAPGEKILHLFLRFKFLTLVSQNKTW